MMSSNKQLSPLEQIRAEKLRLKTQYKSDGERLVQNWDYLSNNVGSIFFNTIINSAKGIIGGGSGQKNRIPTPFGQSSAFQSVFNGLTASLPMVWDLVQPMLIGFMVKKVKNLFSFKKKKKKDIENSNDE